MTAMRSGLPLRTLGRTGLQVTRLGYGAMSLDDGRLTPVSDEQAAQVLAAVLDAGINFLDTSPDYGHSEERIGRFIAGRRDEFILATKCGCPVAPGVRDHEYTRANIFAAVEQSLRRMHTDYIDVLQFHGNPSAEALASGEAVQALRDLQQLGKVRWIGVSGTLPHLPTQIGLGVFDTFQIPYSALQRDHEALITEAAQAGAGTVIRGGAVRGGPSPEKEWDVRRLPEVAAEKPRALWEEAQLDELLDGMGRMEFTLRFTFSHPDLDTAIVGTANPAHLSANIEAVQRGPLSADLVAEVKRRLDAVEASV